MKLRLPHFLRRDVHAGENGQYTIRSLYFDNLQYEAFLDKMNGVDPRVKYRIRLYNYNSGFCRLERKEKKGELTRKRGEAISANTATLLMTSPEKLESVSKGSLTGELQELCLGGGMRPQVLVDYDRTTFLCSAGNTRITLDENLRTLPYCTDLFDPHRAMIPAMEPGETILEVKFDEFLPGYLNDLLADIPKAAMSISKFALCLSLI